MEYRIVHRRDVIAQDFDLWYDSGITLVAEQPLNVALGKRLGCLVDRGSEDSFPPAGKDAS
jgi:hypothetical protein